MNKKQLAVLEKIFAAEVDNRLPAQINSKLIDGLEAEGMVTKLVKTFPGRFPVTVHGWELTNLGRFTYCESCKEIAA